MVVHGRADNVINVGGTKTTPELLERELLGAPGVLDCAIICKRDEVGIDRTIAFLMLGPAWNQEAFRDYCVAISSPTFSQASWCCSPAYLATATTRLIARPSPDCV